MGFFATELGRILITFFISMVPVIECRGAIPTGIALGLSKPLVFVLCAVGNMIPVPFIIIFIKRIFRWLRTKSPKLEALVSRLEAKAEGKSDKVVKYGFWGLIIFVGIPLPGTGAWTGALIAALLGMKLKRALPAIVIGVLIACVLIMTLSLGAESVIELL